MPENEIQNMQAPEVASVPETKAQKFERERLTRRQALRKMGMTTAMATFAMFSVDDLARMVGNVIKQRSGDSQVTKQIAVELQQAGVTLASSTPFSICSNSTGNCTSRSGCIYPAKCQGCWWNGLRVWLR